MSGSLFCEINLVRPCEITTLGIEINGLYLRKIGRLNFNELWLVDQIFVGNTEKLGWTLISQKKGAAGTFSTAISLIESLSSTRDYC